jgi:hypothetical protein
MNEQQLQQYQLQLQNKQNASWLERLLGKNIVGQNGIKTDLKVEVLIPDQTYYKLGASMVLVGLCLLAVYYILKKVTA